jgi:hypothetical protein
MQALSGRIVGIEGVARAKGVARARERWGIEGFDLRIGFAIGCGNLVP